MNTSTDRSDLADKIERIAQRFHDGWHEGIRIDATDIMDLAAAAEELRSTHRGAELEPRSMNTCSTCKHWVDDTPTAPYDPPGLGTCLRIRDLAGATERVPLSTHEQVTTGRTATTRLKARYSDVQAFVEDAEVGVDATLRTFPTFGCTMHESK